MTNSENAMDRLIHDALSGAFDRPEGPPEYTKLWHRCINMGLPYARFSDALFRRRLPEEITTYIAEREAGRP